MSCKFRRLFRRCSPVVTDCRAWPAAGRPRSAGRDKSSGEHEHQARFWSSPLATLSAGAGDCEDYAIVKYIALREAGIDPDDLRLLIVRYPRRKTNHAILAVRVDADWLILDNLTLIMVNILEAEHYHPLFALNQRGVSILASANARDRIAGPL